MKICFVVNNVESETCGTTVYLMQEARKRNHEVYAMGVGEVYVAKDEDLISDIKYVPTNLQTQTQPQSLE